MIFRELKELQDHISVSVVHLTYFQMVERL
jgi:glutathionyl-hydroquinone reductase